MDVLRGKINNETAGVISTAPFLTTNPFIGGERIMADKTIARARRFWNRVDKAPGLGPNGDCWEWRGCLTAQGYGKTSHQCRTVIAHRYAYFLTYGEWPTPMGLHRCDNPKCVKPDHIFAGNQQDNVDDMVSKKRNSVGSNRPASHLTEGDVMVIRSEVKQGTPQVELCARFKMSKSGISQIVRGKTWKHME